MRVLVLGAGGPAAIGFCNSLRFARRLNDAEYYLIGADGNPENLEMATTDERHWLPNDDLGALLRLIEQTKPDLVHAQPDTSVWFLSQNRNEVRRLGPKVFLPRHDVIKVCRDKWLSWQAWNECGVPVPQTWLIENEDDLRDAFESSDGLWFRPAVGAGGIGSFSTRYRDLAEMILTERDVWGEYTAAEILSSQTVVWQALYFHGNLVASQTRRRLAWTEGSRGSCRIGETFTDPAVDKRAQQALRAVDMFPHGIYGVDLCLSHDGEPMPTEINVGRFNTTIEFYAQAGLNMPHMFAQLALGHEVEMGLENPLPNGLLWVRSMDRPPLLLDHPLDGPESPADAIPAVA